MRPCWGRKAEHKTPKEGLWKKHRGASVQWGWAIQGGFLEEELLEMDKPKVSRRLRVSEALSWSCAKNRNWGEDSAFRNPKRRGGAECEVRYMAVHRQQEILVHIFFDGWRTSSRCFGVLLETSSKVCPVLSVLVSTSLSLLQSPWETGRRQLCTVSMPVITTALPVSPY